MFVQFRMFVEFLLQTGLRREEGLNLKWGDIDFIRNVIAVVKTKGREVRLVPLTFRCLEILKILGPQLFDRLNKNVVTKRFGKYCEAEELGGFKLHSLRHTYATKLIDAGVDILTVSRLMGHSDIKTSMIYAKAQLPVLERAVKMLESGFGGNQRSWNGPFFDTAQKRKVPPR
jgi:integrase